MSKIIVKTENIDKDHEYLREKVKTYNISQVGTFGRQKPVFMGQYDDSDNLMAGLYGYLFWGMLYIDLLWVDEKYRHQKIGNQLMQKAEKFAKEKECLYARVNTATFQALDFYKKCGYEVFGKLPLKIEGYKDQYDYYLVKYLK